MAKGKKEYKDFGELIQEGVEEYDKRQREIRSKNILPPALAALCIKAHIDAGPTGEDPDVQRLANAPLYVHAQKSLDASFVSYDPYAAPDEIIGTALAQDGPEHFRMEGGASNRPGSFPNLLSGLANKILDEGVQQADTPYKYWTGRLTKDLPDFKPEPIVAKGKVGELDEIMDGEELRELDLDEEMLSFMQLGRFGNKVKLTPETLANDDLGAFAEDLLGLAEGLELSINRLCLRPIVANVELLDGFALYDDTNHGNDIASGGAPPSDSEWDKMAIKASKQMTIGGKAYAAVDLGVVLCPPTLWRGAAQSFWKFNSIGESKQAATDSDLSVYRGAVTVVKEPELQYVSDKVWYAFASPRRTGNATVVRGYMKGFPEGGKRERWYEPGTKCMNFSLEGRFAAAVKNFRTTARNKGEA